MKPNKILGRPISFDNNIGDIKDIDHDCFLDLIDTILGYPGVNSIRRSQCDLGDGSRFNEIEVNFTGLPNDWFEIGDLNQELVNLIYQFEKLGYKTCVNQFGEDIRVLADRSGFLLSLDYWSTKTNTTDTQQLDIDLFSKKKARKRIEKAMVKKGKKK